MQREDSQPVGEFAQDIEVAAPEAVDQELPPFTETEAATKMPELWQDAPAPNFVPEPMRPNATDKDEVLDREGEISAIADLNNFATASREYRATLHEILRRIVADLQVDHALLQGILRHFELSRRTPV